MKKIFAASALAIAALSVSPMFAAPAAAQARSVAVADVRVTTSDGRLVIAAEHLLYCYQETA